MSLVTVSSLHVLLFSKGFTNAYARGGKREDWWVGGLQEVLDNEAVNLQRERSRANAVRNSLEEIRRQLAQAQQEALLRSADHDDLKEKHAKAKRARDQLDARNEDLKRRVSAVSAQLAEAQEALRLEQDLRVAAQAQLALAIEGVKVPEADETSHLKALEGARSTTLNIVYNNTVGMTGEMIHNVQTWLYALQHVSGTKTDGTKFERYNVRSVTTGCKPGEVNVPVPAPDISGSIAKVEAYEAKVAELEREIADLKAVRDTNKEWLDGWVKKDEASEARIAQLEAALYQKGELAPERYEAQVKKLEGQLATALGWRDDWIKKCEELEAKIVRLEADLKGFVGDGSNLGGLYIDGGTLWLRRAIWDAIRKGPKEQIAALKGEVAMLQNRLRALEAPVPQNVKSVGDVEGSMWVTILREDYHDLKARAERTDKADHPARPVGMIDSTDMKLLHAPFAWDTFAYRQAGCITALEHQVEQLEQAKLGWQRDHNKALSDLADARKELEQTSKVLSDMQRRHLDEVLSEALDRRSEAPSKYAKIPHGYTIGAEFDIAFQGWDPARGGDVTAIADISNGVISGITIVRSVETPETSEERAGPGPDRGDGEHGAEDFSSQIPHVQV